MASPLTKTSFVRLLTAGLEEDFTGGYKEMESIKEKIFDVVVNKNAWTEYFGIGDVPDPVAFDGLISYQDVAPRLLGLYSVMNIDNSVNSGETVTDYLLTAILNEAPKGERATTIPQGSTFKRMEAQSTLLG